VRRDGSNDGVTVRGDVLIGADGIHSTVRSILYPNEGALVWSGYMLWRGVAEWPVYRDGRTMVIAGGNAAPYAFPVNSATSTQATCPTS
jgi:2-polyprenyl-6-methoxyphenol hydroxylase-like FAD-dependent oxidoreductase